MADWLDGAVGNKLDGGEDGLDGSGGDGLDGGGRIRLPPAASLSSPLPAPFCPLLHPADRIRTAWGGRAAVPARSPLLPSSLSLSLTHSLERGAAAMAARARRRGSGGGRAGSGLP